LARLQQRVKRVISETCLASPVNVHLRTFDISGMASIDAIAEEFAALL
jgi:hypothetical protein